MNFTQEQYIIIGSIALASFFLGLIITWATTSGKTAAQLATLEAEKTAETQRVEDTKQRLASTQEDRQALRDAELNLKQELASVKGELKASLAASAESNSLLDGINSLDEQLKQHIETSKKTLAPQDFIEPMPGEGDFADLSIPPAFTPDPTLKTEFEGFTADSEGSGI